VHDGLNVPSQQTFLPPEQPHTPLCHEQQPLWAETGREYKKTANTAVNEYSTSLLIKQVFI